MIARKSTGLQPPVQVALPILLVKIMEKGWIKIHRKLLENPITKNPLWSWLWVVMLLKANHKPAKIIWNGKATLIKVGQMITSRDKLAEASRDMLRVGIIGCCRQSAIGSKSETA